MGGCSTVVGYAHLAEKEIRMHTTLVVALEGGDVTKCRASDVSAFFELVSLWAAREKP